METGKYKKLLEEELALLERELASVGVHNPNNPADWQAKAENLNIPASDNNDLADTFDRLEERVGITNELEVRYNNVKRALKKIEDGKYGACEMDGEEIESDRLDANPAARTCKKHMNDENRLTM